MVSHPAGRLALAAGLAAALASAAVEPRDLTEFSLEELGRIRVTSAARKEQSLLRVAAAAYVVTAEDIRRSGALSIPEALRIVPGLTVARIDANQWAVSVRGFNGRFSNKLLVMVDGRTVYNPLFSGVYWDAQDVLLENVDRIEVIRGPGATLWGVNAVNGVINILTKKASDTQGGLVASGFGTRDGPLTTLRYGGALGRGHYRFSARGQSRRASPPGNGLGRGADPWRTVRGGFRLDLPLGARDSLEVHADVQRGSARMRTALVEGATDFGVVRATPLDSGAENVQIRWRRRISDKAEWTVQAYYASLRRSDALVSRYQDRTADVETQYRRTHSRRWESTWGLGARVVGIRLEPGGAVWAARTNDSFRYLSGFVQEEVELVPERLTATVGVKVEDGTLGGLTPQPSARIIWTPEAQTALWGSVSRATRIPSWGEQNATFRAGTRPGPAGLAAVAEVVPSPGFGNETLTAYEAGLRLQPSRRIGLDLATFHNAYDGLRSFGFGAPELVTSSQPYLRLPIRFTNENAATSYGAELATVWRLTSKWRLTANQSYFKMRLQTAPGGLIDEFDDRVAPTHQTGLRSTWRFVRGASLDLSAYWRSRSEAGGFLQRGEPVDARWRGDFRLNWRVAERTWIQVGGQDLLGTSQAEFQPEALVVGSPRGRNLYGRISWVL